ncbi:hypothetical protein LAZ67_23001026 [Cordylochernes scorpioides]|uniref:Uncharacterized protein n=1 Tax=Cordylochernes scorpioides TaxID=51811 RepID=A0ABY6LQD8_9ARAC|nr:hypothetical protein LAZ67_23001026 [Cordylochernes scorpioides]
MKRGRPAMSWLKGMKKTTGSRLEEIALLVEAAFEQADQKRGVVEELGPEEVALGGQPQVDLIVEVLREGLDVLLMGRVVWVQLHAAPTTVWWRIYSQPVIEGISDFKRYCVSIDPLELANKFRVETARFEELYKNEPFLDHIVTCDEKWILYDNWRRSAQWLDRDAAPKHFPKPKLH